MNSDFRAARLAMEQALNYVRGRDPTSSGIRESIDLLIEVVITAEFTKRKSAGEITRLRASNDVGSARFSSTKRF